MREILSIFIVALTILSMSCKNETETTGKYDDTNKNMNEKKAFVRRLEFPRLKGGKSVVVTHILENDEVNYSLEWDGDKRSNRWTCYQLYSSNCQQNVKRWRPENGENQYPDDPKLPAGYAFSYDHYVRSGYDHGHLCPSADRLASLQANKQTFFISNMQPQVHNFNDGIWATMERWVRNQITFGSPDTLFVCRGGTIDKPEQISKKLKDGFIVPGYFFSAVLLKYRDPNGAWQYKALGFWFEHKANKDADLRKYVVNIDRLESLTGLDFFCNLPDNIETRVESLPIESILSIWNFASSAKKQR